jgi:hypothetical protein
MGKQISRLQARKDELSEFVRQYYGAVLRELRIRWPKIPFSVSYSLSWSDILADPEDCDFLDFHMWAENAPCQFLKSTRYAEAIAKFGERPMIRGKGSDTYLESKRLPPPDIDFEEINEEIQNCWLKSRSLCEEWLEEQIASTASIGRRYQLPTGCTEGWGSVMWVQHPMLSWDMIKDAGLFAARAARRYGYAFNCQSNFCAPQYISLWNDIDYHRKVTGIIRGRES